MHNYEYLLENLINKQQIYGNLRRTAKKGLISKLNKRQMTELALKYFGVDNHGNYASNKNDIVAYKCPYTGEIITNMDDIVLDHIIPVYNGGGTTIFNCIPISKQANFSKSSKNLLTWLDESNNFDVNRFKLLICYIMDAYSKLFDEELIENTQESYEDIDFDINIDGDLEFDKREEALLYNINKDNQKYTYLQFITICIEVLKQHNELEENENLITVLNKLKDKNIFEDISKFEQIEKIVLDEFNNILGIDSREYITYSLDINVYKLMNSFKTNDYKKELHERIIYIEKLLRENNLLITGYFKSLNDIDEFNIIYSDVKQINNNDISNFIDNIIITHEMKIKIIIDMLNHGNINVLKQINEEKFTTYKKDKDGKEIINKEYGQVGMFWTRNKSKILKLLYEREIDNPKYDIARNVLDEYYMLTNGGQQSLEGQNRRLEIFIDMLNHGNMNALNSKGKEKFTTYKKDKDGKEIINKEYGQVGSFWLHNKLKILKLLYEEEIDNPKYDIARNVLDEYCMLTSGGQQSIEGQNRRLEIFIDMLNHSNINVFNSKGKEKFTTYKKDKDGKEIINKEYGQVGRFWANNKDKILKLLYEEIDNPKYDIARNILDEYYMLTNGGQQSLEGQNRRLEIFIDMLNHGNMNALNSKGKEKFTTYKKDKDGKEIINKEYGQVGIFWTNKKDKILNLLYKEEIDNPKYDIARDVLDEYYMLTSGGQQSIEGQNRRLEIFIDMLNHGNMNALNRKGKEKFTTYKKDKDGKEIINKEYGQVGMFWSHNKPKILNLLYKEEIDNPKYDIARNTIMAYLNQIRKKEIPEYKTIEDYIATLNQTKNEVKELIELRNNLTQKKQELEQEVMELNNSERKGRAI